ALEPSDAVGAATIAHRLALDALVDWDCPGLVAWADEAIARADVARTAALEARTMRGLGLAGCGRIDEALAEFDSSGLGQKAGMWARAVESTVRTGRNACLTLIHTVTRLARQDGKTAPFAISEEYWIAAAAELGI
ncbi:MAG TPA: hypothetical protein PK438_09525, partial [Clostridia bacterium]|nr:hypothetical protein [Clostridia bacterium]